MNEELAQHRPGVTELPSTRNATRDSLFKSQVANNERDLKSAEVIIEMILTKKYNSIKLFTRILPLLTASLVKHRLLARILIQL